MERIGERTILQFFPGTNIEIPLGGINTYTVLNTLIVMVLLWGLMWYATRERKRVPGRGQMLVETILGAFDDLVSASLELPEKRQNRAFFPLIASMFVFLLLSNFIGYLPTHYFEEPTADINTTLSLGILGMAIATYCGVRAKGAGGYFEELLGPLWSQEGATGFAWFMGKASAIFFFPLNVIGELAKIVSISFRLFGNILGGAIIIIVVSTLTYNFIFPIGLDLFFIFFVGTIQAFVFTMLTLTYIAVAIK